MPVEKAIIINTHDPEETPIPVMFNPQEYTLSKANNFQEQTIRGLSSPNLQYTGGSARSLSMKLFFDSYDNREDVRFYTNRVTSLMAVTPKEDGKKNTFVAPVLIFSWGTFSFRCVLTQVTEQFTLFLWDGTPVRGELTVAFKETWAQTQGAESDRKAVKNAPSPFYRVKQAQTLASIAGRKETLNDPRRWREIAELNGLGDDFKSLRNVPVGTLLRIPR